jgi:archaellum biogenesis ATPase FlaH
VGVTKFVTANTAIWGIFFNSSQVQFIQGTATYHDYLKNSDSLGIEFVELF